MVTPAGRADRAQETLLALLAKRAAEATLCPSEVARALATSHGASSDWRPLMPDVHAAVDRLAAKGVVRLSWKGAAMPYRDGPYRIARGPRTDAPT